MHRSFPSPSGSRSSRSRCRRLRRRHNCPFRPWFRWSMRSPNRRLRRTIRRRRAHRNTKSMNCGQRRHCRLYHSCLPWDSLRQRDLYPLRRLRSACRRRFRPFPLRRSFRLRFHPIVFLLCLCSLVLILRLRQRPPRSTVFLWQSQIDCFHLSWIQTPHCMFRQRPHTRSDLILITNNLLLIHQYRHHQFRQFLQIHIE